MVERDGWKPRNKEAAFNEGSQGGNTSGGEASPQDHGSGSEETGEGLPVDIQKRLAEVRESSIEQARLADTPDRPLPPDIPGGFCFINPLPSPGAAEWREKELERRRARNEQRRKRYSQRRSKGRHGGGDQSPGPNNPSS